MHSYRRLRMVMVSALGTSACAACRVLRRKCTAQCLFAPFFPPDQPQKFAHVHKVCSLIHMHVLPFALLLKFCFNSSQLPRVPQSILYLSKNVTVDMYLR